VSEPAAATLLLLQRWHAGDDQALADLVRQELPWVRTLVERRVGELLRQRADVDDFVQQAMLEVLRYGPRFVVESVPKFRSLMARIVENVIRDRNEYFRARRRDLARERPLPADTVLHLDPPQDSVTRPSQAAARAEGKALVRVALELLDPADREVLLLRQWEELSFAAIGARLGIGEDAARMRFARAVGKLGGVLRGLGRRDPDALPR
jgi:RNA polymerase sigma-70 factor (ECF subfamily)